MKMFFFKTIKMILYTMLILIISVVAFLNFAPTFGSKAQGESLEKIMNSENFDGKRFNNLVQTPRGIENSQNNGSMWEFFFPKKGKNPTEPLPSKKLKSKLENDSFTWFGHSTILMKTNNITIMTDPVFYRASPLPIGMKPFKQENPTKINDLPNIDIVIISHDHYDHLDHRAIKEINPKVEKFIVPLGVGAHLMRWGVEENKITELDWYESKSYNEVNLTLTPTRHFSGRSLTNRDSTLWGSWVVKSNSTNIFFSGDTGYFDEFKKIGNNYGPFDIAFIENGAYNDAWANIHMKPEESVQTGLDLGAKLVIPIHWSKFDLSYHTWVEPIERFSKEANDKNLNYATPIIGETFTINNVSNTNWWEDVN